MTGRDGPGQCEAATSDQWDHRSDPAGAWTSAAPGRVDSLQSRSCSYVASFTPVLCCVSSPAVHSEFSAASGRIRLGLAFSRGGPRRPAFFRLARAGARGRARRAAGAPLAADARGETRGSADGPRPALKYPYGQF